MLIGIARSRETMTPLMCSSFWFVAFVTYSQRYGECTTTTVKSRR